MEGGSPLAVGRLQSGKVRLEAEKAPHDPGGPEVRRDVDRTVAVRLRGRVRVLSGEGAVGERSTDADWPRQCQVGPTQAAWTHLDGERGVDTFARTER